MIERSPAPNEQALNYIRATSRSPKNFEDRSIDEARDDFFEECERFGGPLETVTEVRDINLDGLNIRVYYPDGDETDALVWLHGGGWTIGGNDCFDALVRSLAVKADCAVLSVDYRLAPEFQYPAAIDDAWTAVEWAVANFRNVAVGGDSSGGNLAAGSAFRARESGVHLALQMLVYPMLDYRIDDAMYSSFAQRYEDFAGIHGYGREFLEMMSLLWSRYIPDAVRRSEVCASPLRAATFEGLAAAFVIEAEHDILRDEDSEYVQKLRAANVEVEEIVFEGQIHGFFHLLGLMPDAREAVKICAVALKKAFHS